MVNLVIIRISNSSFSMHSRRTWKEIELKLYKYAQESRKKKRKKRKKKELRVSKSMKMTRKVFPETT
jgi:hypothetical protein